MARQFGIAIFWLGMAILAYGLAGIFGILVALGIFMSTRKRDKVKTFKVSTKR